MINLFYRQEELARLEEQKTDAILDGKKDSDQSQNASMSSKSQEEFIEETVAKRKDYETFNNFFFMIFDNCWNKFFF